MIALPGLDDFYIWRKAEHGWEDLGRIPVVGNIPDFIRVLSSSFSPSEPFPPFSSCLESTETQAASPGSEMGEIRALEPAKIFLHLYFGLGMFLI